MLTPRLLSSCEGCSDILTLIQEIDCKLAKLSGNLYFNLTLMLNKPVPASTFIDLLSYKRILLYKYVDSSYCSDFTVSMIASKVKLLKFK